jgi:N6-adenosine-specific RNA methylase IME4
MSGAVFHMRHAFAALDAWGFEDRTILTWVKDRLGTGDWLRAQTEHCLMAVRGKPIVRSLIKGTLVVAQRAAIQPSHPIFMSSSKVCAQHRAMRNCSHGAPARIGTATAMSSHNESTARGRPE